MLWPIAASLEELNFGLPLESPKFAHNFKCLWMLVSECFSLLSHFCSPCRVFSLYVFGDFLISPVLLANEKITNFGQQVSVFLTPYTDD